MNNKLFIGGISFNTTESKLNDAFATFGAIEDLVIIKDRDTGRSKGFGFITFATQQSAEEAIKEMDQKVLDDRTITVKAAQDKKRDGGGDRGRGGWK